MNVAVFCSCSELASPFLFAEAAELGRGLARAGHAVVYGGSSGGCMGALARGVLDAGGPLIGVVPESELGDCVLQDGLHACHYVPNLSVRKQKMIALADAFVVFPGGLGTLDEAFTVLTLKSLGNFFKPIVFYNFMDVWSPTLEALDLLIQQRLVRLPAAELFVTLDTVDQVREHLGLVGAGGPGPSAESVGNLPTEPGRRAENARKA